MATIKNLFNEFQRGFTYVFDDEAVNFTWRTYFEEDEGTFISRER